MLLLLIKKEITHNILSFRFVVTYALLFCLVILAMFLMTNDYRARRQEYAAARIEERDQLARLAKIADPNEQFQQLRRSVLHGARPPRNLSLLARGLEGSLPTGVSSRSFLFVSSGAERLGKNMLFAIFQAPDFVYIVNIITSLLALLFVFDAVCGEKERGTLKLLLAHSVPRDTVLLGKWIGGYISIVAPFGVAVLGGFAYIYIAGTLEEGGDSLERFGVIFALALLYISAFFTLGLLISSRTQRSATALLLALLVWIVWILVVPNLAPVVARLAAPVPGRQVIEAEKQAIQRESQLMLEGIQKRRVYGDPAAAQRIQQQAQKRQNKLEQFYQDKMQSQIALGQNLARLSPSASFLFAATRLAGTGPELYRYFRQAQERFQQSYQKYMQNIFSQEVEFTRQGPRVRDPHWFKSGEVPRFRMAGETLNDSFNAALFDILLLVVYNVLFFMLAFVSFLRYDIT